MNASLVAAFVAFAIVALYTPGQNNVMLLASGLNFGFRRTLPHMAGVAAGFAFMFAAVGGGLGAVFVTYPWLQTVLKYAGVAYLLYLAYCIAVAEPLQDGEGAQGGRPMTFFGAALFQWINAKGWVIVVGTITAYDGIAAYPWNIALQTLIILSLGLTSASAWALFGSSLRHLIRSPSASRAFNIVMALLLVASLYPVIWGA